jgi:hypothetical protein
MMLENKILILLTLLVVWLFWDRPEIIINMIEVFKP